MVKILVYLFFISLFPGSIYSESLYIQSMDEARNYILEKKYNEAAQKYLNLANDKNLSMDLKSSSLLLYSLTMWKKLNNNKKAVIVLNQILNDFSNTDSAGDALYFLGLIEKESLNLKKSIKYFKLFLEKHPNHTRNKNAKEILKKINHLSKTDNIKIKVLLKSIKEPVFLSDKGFIFNNINEKITTKVSDSKTIIINSFDTGEKSVLIRSKDNITTFEKRRYNGDFVLYLNNNAIDIINIVELKSYLESVVPSEMPGKWHMEALKAQAVISRSYALYMIEKNKNAKYHLEAGTFSQVYKGLNSVCRASKEAVKATQSQVLTYKNNTILAAFHANSGGVTEDPYYPWNEKFNYLNSFKDRYSPSHEWSVKLTLDELSYKIFNNRYKIKDIDIIKRTPSGRVFSLELDTDMGKIIIKGKKFREKTGIFFVKSTLFKLKKHKNLVVINGRGFGHGVGLSQWGAKVMAEKGFKYKDIIKFYYSDKIRINSEIPGSIKKDPGNIFLSKLF